MKKVGLNISEEKEPDVINDRRPGEPIVLRKRFSTGFLIGLGFFASAAFIAFIVVASAAALGLGLF